MNRYVTGVMVAAMAAAATMLYPAPAFADHRPGNVVVMGGTLALTGRLAVRAKRYLNARKIFVDELNARDGLFVNSGMGIIEPKRDIYDAFRIGSNP